MEDSSVIMKIFFSILALNIAASEVFAQEDHKIISSTSEKNRNLSLEFSTLKVTKNNKSAVLCSEPSQKTTFAKLWMPEHGHGSTPTKLTAREDGCTNIEKINFTMDGNWEIKVTFEGGDKGVFSFEVEP